MRSLLTLIVLALLPGLARAQAARILLDGTFDDWAGLAPAHDDPTGDAAPAPAAVDFGRLWVSNDDRFFFLRVELGVESLIQEINEIILYLDTDDDAATGLPVHGLGAELAWTFGQRAGIFTAGAAAQAIGHDPIGIVTAPTTTSTVFEVALERDALPDGQNALFPGATVRVALEDAAGGDLLPDAPGGVAFTFDDATALPPLLHSALARQAEADVRLLSYNVERDALFDAGRQPAFARILQALRPDVIGFQEILAHSAEQTRRVVETALPLPGGAPWHAARIDPDLVVVSRYPVRRSLSIEGSNPGRANAAFVLDLQDAWGTDLLLIVAHPPCCRADAARQVEFDAIMAFLRDAQAAGGPLDLAPQTPIVLLGDMNMVGFVQQLNTLLEGQIVDTARFGPSFAPDWDGSALADRRPRHVALPMTYTWYRASSSFHPGRLDYIIYTDSVLEPGNGFVLFTPAMTPDALAAHGLLPDDATRASDHLPVVGDFRFLTDLAADDLPETPSLTLDPSFPNPFRTSTRLAYVLPAPGPARLAVYDVLGREVAVLVDAVQAAGRHTVAWHATGLPAGPYFYRLKAGHHTRTRAMLLMR